MQTRGKEKQGDVCRVLQLVFRAAVNVAAVNVAMKLMDISCLFNKTSMLTLRNTFRDVNCFKHELFLKVPQEEFTSGLF